MRGGVDAATTARNKAQGLEYLADVLAPVSVEAWAAQTAAAASASDNAGWASLSVRSAIAAVMEAFSERGFVRRGARICESQMAALRVGFTEALKRYFLGKPPNGYFGGIAAYDDMHRACNVASNEASRAGGVGHVTNRLQKTTAAQLSRVSSALHSLADTAGAQYKALVLHVELTWSLLGKRSHNIDKAIFGQIDFKQLGGGDGTKPVWHAGGRPWILRFNTIRKGAASQGNETLVCVMANKDVRFCPLLSVGIKELYLHATAGLAKPPISLERWLFKYEDKVANGGPGYERPFLISRLAARDYDRPHAATKHGEELNKVAAAEGVSFLGGVFFALRNWRVMQLSADVRTAAEVGAAVSLHNITKREASYGDENVNVVLAQAGYSSSSALESPCAPHRVLNHYLTHKMDVVRGLVSLLMPPAFLAARDSALALDSKDEKSSEYQLKQHYMLLDFLFTHVLVLCHARPLNNDALIDADAKPLIDTFALLRSLLSPILKHADFVQIGLEIAREEEFDLRLGPHALASDEAQLQLSSTNCLIHNQTLDIKASLGDVKESLLHSLASPDLRVAAERERLRELAGALGSDLTGLGDIEREQAARVLTDPVLRAHASRFSTNDRVLASDSLTDAERSLVAMGPPTVDNAIAPGKRELATCQTDFRSDFAAPAPLPSPPTRLLLPPPDAPLALPAPPPAPQPHFPGPDAYRARTKKFPELLRFYASTLLPLDVEQPGWRSRAWSTTTSAQREAVSSLSFAVDHLVFEAGFLISNLTRTLRDFESRGVTLTQASGAGKQYNKDNPGSSTRARNLREGSEWVAFQSAVLESAAPPPAPAAQKRARPSFYVALDPAESYGCARFDIGDGGEVERITASVHVCSGEAGAALHAARGFLSEAVSGAEHVFYESFFPHAKSKFDFSIALKNIGFRSVVEEVCFASRVACTAVNPISWPQNEAGGGLGASSLTKPAYRAAIEARFDIKVPFRVKSDAVDAVGIGLWGLSKLGIRPEKQLARPIFEWL